MKKIICLLLALTFTVALCACGGGDDKDEAFFAVVENSTPSTIKTLTSHTRPNGVYYTGVYETNMTESGFEFTYQYEQRAPITPDGTGSVETVGPHTVVYDGKGYTVDGEATTSAPEVAYLGIKMDIIADVIGDYTITADGLTLTAELSADEVKSIFGTDINTTANLTVTIDGVHLSSVKLEYTTADSTHVLVTTTYTYSASQVEAQ